MNNGLVKKLHAPRILLNTLRGFDKCAFDVSNVGCMVFISLHFPRGGTLLHGIHSKNVYCERRRLV